MIETWASYATVWAGVEPLNGKEYIAANSHHHEITARIVVRYRSDIDATHRVKYLSDVYEILSVINRNMENRDLELLVRLVKHDLT